VKAMLIDSDEAIKRMQDVIEHYKKYGYKVDEYASDKALWRR
jgi:hypothetical protein